MTKANAVSLNDKLKKNIKKLVKDQDLDATLKELATELTPTLPLGINDALGYTIAISEMKFTATKNTLVAIAILPFIKVTENDILAFAAGDIQFNGSSPVVGGGKLGLIGDITLVDPSEKSYGITVKGEKNNIIQSYVEVDCNGFKNFQASIDVAFPRAWMTPVPANGAKDNGIDKVVANAQLLVNKDRGDKALIMVSDLIEQGM